MQQQFEPLLYLVAPSPSQLKSKSLSVSVLHPPSSTTPLPASAYEPTPQPPAQASGGGHPPSTTTPQPQASTSGIRPAKRSSSSSSSSSHSSNDEKRRRVSDNIFNLQHTLQQFKYMLLDCNGIDDDFTMPIQSVLETTIEEFKRVDIETKNRARSNIKRLTSVYFTWGNENTKPG